MRGTTLRQSILRILDRLEPRRIIVVSSSPQVRYPDYYGIDMPHLDELAAFRAAVSLLEHSGQAGVLDDVYARCMAEIEKPEAEMTNAVKEIYDRFSDREIAEEMARMLRPDDIKASVDILFQSLEGLHDAIPGCRRLVFLGQLSYSGRHTACQPRIHQLLPQASLLTPLIHHLVYIFDCVGVGALGACGDCNTYAAADYAAYDSANPCEVVGLSGIPCKPQGSCR